MEGIHQSCLHKKHCPISGSTCPGVCVYSNILKNVNFGIILLDIATQSILFKNQPAIDILEEQNGPFNYKDVVELICPNVEDVFLQDCPYKQDALQLENKTVGFTVYHTVNRFIWIHVKDITEDLRLTNIAEAVNCMNNLGYIVSGIRHELGNPINSTKMALSVLKEKIETCSPEESLTFINRSLYQIDRVEYLLKALKTFNMYETPSISNVYIPEFMNRFLQLVKHDFKEKNIHITTKLHDDVSVGKADPRMLQQVLLNILTNAVDSFIDHNNPFIHINVESHRENLIFNISDNGCGMTEEQIENLFIPFNTSKKNGTGLGLVIVKKMLAFMNSTINVKSIYKMGTTVQIIIPGEPA